MTVQQSTEAGAAESRARRPSRAASRIRDVGEILSFFGWTIRDVAMLRRYSSEVLRQSAAIVTSSAIVLWFMEFMLGTVLAIEGHYLFRQIGAQSYVGAIPAVFDARGAAQTMWGWILAAKVGCGIVAELGSMRISEEVDALEVMGIHSRAYLASTRLVAAIVTTPFLFITGYLLAIFGAFVENVYVLHTVSEGGFLTIVWAFQNTTSFVFGVLWALVVTIIVILVACFFGYTASGGPVGVGRATAQSMLVNMVLISVIAMVLVRILYSNNPNAPIAN